jgi:Na+/H+ antiporter NhaD/arsenite permease-like protein
MGANTYIGNGPNFMVKSMAEASGYRMPSFGRYALMAILVLSPIYIATAFLVGLY